MTENTQTQTGGSGNQPVGKVVILYGTVKAVATDGTERVLAPNSPIFMGDHIITGPDGMVSVIFDADGTQLDLGRMSDAFIDQDVAGGGEVAGSEEMAAQVADIQQALVEGDVDQILDLPAPAAGGGVAGAGGDHPYPVFEIDGDAVLPEFGQETTGITYTTLDPMGGGLVEEPTPEPDIPPPPPPPPVPPGETPPAAVGTALIVDEADITDSDSSPTLTFTAGTDPLVSFVFSDDLSGLITNTDGIAGDDISWVRVNDTTIEGIVDGKVALTITLNAPGSIAAGTSSQVTVTVTLTDAFSHPPGDGAQTINIGTIAVIGSEADGDLIAAPVAISVVDDVPVVQYDADPGVVEEEALADPNLSDGNPDDTGNSEIPGTTDPTVATVTGNLLASIDIGADDPGTFSFSADLNAMPIVESQGHAVNNFQTSGNVVEAYSDDGRLVYTLEVDVINGTYTFTLNDQLDHAPPAPGEAVENSLQLDFSNVITIHVTDADGDTASANAPITVSVYDDIPTIDISQMAEATVTASVLEDGLSYEGDPGDPDLSEGNRESGETVNDDETSDETGGNLQSLFSTAFSVGSDEHAPETEYTPTVEVSISQDTSGMDTLYSQGEQLYYIVNQDGTSLEANTAADGSGRTVFTLNVNPDGSWNFDLDDQLDHVIDNNTEGWTLQGSTANSGGIDFSSVITGTATGIDFDGDEVTDTTSLTDNTFVIDVQDDIPEVITEGVTLTVYEDALGNDAPDITNTDNNPDADLSTGNIDDGARDTDSASVDLDSLFSVGADEPLTYSLNVITEGNDANSNTGLTSQGDTIWVVDDGNGGLKGVTYQNNDQQAGVEDRTVFQITLDSNTNVLTFDLDDQIDHSDGDDLDSNTNVLTFDLDDQIDHSDGDDPDSELLATPINVGQYVDAMDFDEDVKNLDGLINVQVENDIPEIGTAQDGLLANETGNSITGSLDVSVGADELASINLLLTDGDAVNTILYNDQDPSSPLTGPQMTNNGEPLTWQDNGDGTWSAVSQQDDGNGGTTTVKSFTISVNETDGTYTVFMDDGLDGKESTQTIDFSDALNGGNTYQAVFGSTTATTTEVEPNVFYGENGIFVQATASLDASLFTNDPVNDFDMVNNSATVNYANEGVGVDTGATVDGDDSSGDRISEVLSIKFYSSIVVSESGNSQDKVNVLESAGDDGGTPNDPTDDQYQSTVLNLSAVTFTIDHLGSAEDLYYALYDADGNFLGKTTVAISNPNSNAGGASADQKDYPLYIDGTGLSDQDGNALANDVTQFAEVRFESGDGEWRVESAQIETTTQGYDQTILVPYEAVDADEDTATGDFSVTFDGDDVLDAVVADSIDGDDSINGMVISGSNDADTITGTEYNDTIDGRGGDDIIDGGDGDDTIHGGDGDDTISGDGVDYDNSGTVEATESGDDTIYGGAGDDIIDGGEGNDTIFGDGEDSDGSGTIESDETGNDTISGGAGDDIIVGGEGDDTISGGADNDTLYGDEGDDTINGDAGNDILVGGADNAGSGGTGDTLVGGDGDDTLFAGEETDGDGADTLTGDNPGDSTDTGADTFVDAGGDTITDYDNAGDGDVSGADDANVDDLVPPTEPDPTV